MILLYYKCDQASDLWQQLELASELESDLWDTLDRGKKWLQCWENATGFDLKMDGSVLDLKSSFKMLGLNFSSKLGWGSYIISIAKTASKKIGALIRSVMFLSPEVALYLYKSIV